MKYRNIKIVNASICLAFEANKEKQDLYILVTFFIYKLSKALLKSRHKHANIDNLRK